MYSILRCWETKLWTNLYCLIKLILHFIANIFDFSIVNSALASRGYSRGTIFLSVRRIILSVEIFKIFYCPIFVSLHLSFGLCEFIFIVIIFFVCYPIIYPPFFLESREIIAFLPHPHHFLRCCNVANVEHQECNTQRWIKKIVFKMPRSIFGAPQHAVLVIFM